MEEPDGTDITSVALGDVYRDTVTGFEGKVVGRADYLTGCAQALISHLVAGRVESIWLDYPRLELVERRHNPRISQISPPFAGAAGLTSTTRPHVPHREVNERRTEGLHSSRTSKRGSVKWHLLSRTDQIRRNKNRRAFSLAPREVNAVWDVETVDVGDNELVGSPERTEEEHVLAGTGT